MAGTERVLTLPELQKRALRALDDARLVSLARDKKLSPREVLKCASGLSGLSRRQPEAARCMAVIRRDYGLEALDSFISSMARARAELSATEQAHRGEIMNNRELQSIVGLNDVRAKFELLIKKGYVKEAADFLLELAEKGTAFCWLNVQGGKVVNNPLGDEFRKDTSSNIANVVLVFRQDLKEGFIPLGNQELSIWLVSLVPMLENAGLDDFQNRAQKIVETVLRNTVKHEPRGFEGSPAVYWNVLGTTITKREIWPDCPPVRSDEQELLSRQVEIWQARFHFFGGEMREMSQMVMPAHRKRSQEIDPTRWFDWLVDYLQECGWTIEQVRQEFTEWLERRGSHGLQSEIVIAVAGSRCFQGGGADVARRALRKHLEYFWQNLCRESGYDLSIETFHTLGALGLFGRKDAEFFRRELTGLMADGRVPFVMTVVRDLGVAMGLRTREIGTSGSIKKAVMNVLNSLAPVAFDMAMERQKFGIAAALGQHFNCVDGTRLRLKANNCFREKLIAIYDWSAVLGYEPDREIVLLHILDGECTEGSIDLEDGTKTTWMVASPVLNINCVFSAQQADTFFELRDDRDQLLKTLIELRMTEIKGAVETALALEMPIALDVVTLL